MTARFRSTDYGKAGLSGLFLLWLAAAAYAQPLPIEVQRAEAGFDQRTGEPVVTITMTDKSKQAFADYTTRNVGKPMEIRVDGRAVMKSVIREPILGGRGQIMGGFSVDAARDIVRRLSTGTATIEFEVVGN